MAKHRAYEIGDTVLITHDDGGSSLERVGQRGAIRAFDSWEPEDKYPWLVEFDYADTTWYGEHEFELVEGRVNDEYDPDAPLRARHRAFSVGDRINSSSFGDGTIIGVDPDDNILTYRVSLIREKGDWLWLSVNSLKLIVAAP